MNKTSGSILASLLALIQCVGAATSAVRMLVPGFEVEELPVRLSNQNNLRFAPDGTLTSLGYDGRIWRLRDTNGDGLEDSTELIWDKPSFSVPLGMAWSNQGLLVSSKGKVSLLKDVDGNGVLDEEEVVASGWPSTDVGSGGVDATAVTLDTEGNLYFGLLVADYSNAYRIRKRKDLSAEEIRWLQARGRWRDGSGGDAQEDEFSLYDLESRRGTIQKLNFATRQLSTVATGLRVPVALAFNRAGDLFNTDQEGETWLAGGNPLDELNHIVPGRNYGFPPAHPRWQPGLISEDPVVSFGPQHQSACGLVFNETRTASPGGAGVGASKHMLPANPAQGLFGPKAWEGDALVAGESRGRIWRVRLVKTAQGYVGYPQTVSRVSMLTVDLAISPAGALYLCCHSGEPDWGTGPNGLGKIFKITHRDRRAPVPLSAHPVSTTELRIDFDQPLSPEVVRFGSLTNVVIQFGEYVSAGDRFEVLKPPYSVVQQQEATPRGRLEVRGARLDAGGRTLVLQTDPHPLLTRYSISIPGVKGPDQQASAATIDLDYDFTYASQPIPTNPSEIRRDRWHQNVSWAPRARPTHGTESRMSQKPDGDWEHGRELFLGQQLQCSKCHRVRGEGGTAGPDLSNLVHRDSAGVLRDITEPGATLHPDYVTYVAELNNGEMIQGFVRGQTPESVQVFDVEGRETRIARGQLAALRPSELSLMPSGLITNLSTNDIRDLLTFLAWEPPRRSKESVQPLLSTASARAVLSDAGSRRELRTVLVASKQDHGPGQHDYPFWQTNWFRSLSRAVPSKNVEAAWEWPSDAQFAGARLIVFYYWNHKWSKERLDQLDGFLKRGGGVVLIHSAVIANENPEALAEVIGLSAQPGRTGYRHMPFELQLENEKHEILKGLPSRMELLDEPYWPLIGRTRDVQVIAAAMVDGQSRPLIWTRTSGAGRVFASIPGHYTRTLQDPLFGLILLRGMAWAAGEDLSTFENALPGE